MERSQYKKPIRPLPRGEVLDAAEGLQKKIDKLDEDLAELDRGRKNLKTQLDSKHSQLAIVLRAEATGSKVYVLKGGEFTDEEPGSESQETFTDEDKDDDKD